MTTHAFRLGYVLGATPGKWISVWRERYPRTPLELVPVSSSDAPRALQAREIDMAIVREPINRDDLHAIRLYDEVVGAVVSTDSALSAVDELSREDFAGEVVIVAQDDVVNFGAISGTTAAVFEAPATTEAAIATVAAGVGVVIVPLSVARFFKRKDVTFRPIAGAAPTTVVLAWSRDHDSVEVQNFIGIVRGRTARSSRG